MNAGKYSLKKYMELHNMRENMCRDEAAGFAETKRLETWIFPKDDEKHPQA